MAQPWWSDLALQQAIRERRHGVIETAAGRMLRIRFRWWPRLVSGWEVRWAEWGRSRRAAADHCCLYFSQPRSAPGYLALKYVQSTAGTRYATFLAAIRALDRVAWIKRSDAIVCEAFNQRLSDAMMRRWGWESHLPDSGRRHFIKRFYGDWSAVCGTGAESATVSQAVEKGCEADSQEALGLLSIPVPVDGMPAAEPACRLGFTPLAVPATLRAGSAESVPG